MNVLRHTLVSEGTTDANLIPIIDWTLRETGGIPLSEGVRAEFWRLPEPPDGPVERFVKAAELFPCDVLFIHRDADKLSLDARVEEIREAFAKAKQRGVQLPAVAIVPVKMLEAWLCFDEQAVRKAAGNPNGTVPLCLPPLRRVETRPDPKDELKQALRAASQLTGRRLKKFSTATAFWRIVDWIEDFSPLRELPAFRSFEKSIQRLKENGWKSGFYG